MKTKYLEQLREKLNEFQACREDIDEIISDYGQLYDDAYENKGSDEAVWKLLGDPKDVAYELIDTLKTKKEKGIRNKIIAIMPFVSVIIFFVLGLYYDLWHPGWLVFLSIPITAILLTTKLKDGVVALSPFLSVIVFLILGIGFNLWHPGWLIFLSIPIIAIVLNTSAKEIPIAISPMVSVIVFVILGVYYDLWNPGWLVFVSIPMIGVLYKRKWLHSLLYELSFIIAIVFYLFMGYTYGAWTNGALGFLLPLIIGLLLGDIHILWSDEFKAEYRAKTYMIFGSIALAIAIFLSLGFALNGWAYAWQSFLIIPVVAIVTSGHFKWTAVAPFIAVVLFFSLGYFFDLFHISWLAFFLIPMTAIIENA